MEAKPLPQQIAEMRQSFFDEEILGEQFIQLEKLEGENNPFLVEEILTLFFRDSTSLLDTLQKEMGNGVNCVDVYKVDRILHQLKGSTGSIGAKKLQAEIINSRKLWNDGNVEQAKVALEEVQKEHCILKAKLEPYFQQLKQTGPIETAMHPK